MPVTVGCVNSDFEASPAGTITVSNQVSGWTAVGGSNNPYLPNITQSTSTQYDPYFPNGNAGASSCNLLGCCPKPPSESEIIDCSAPGGYIDQTIGPGYPIFSVFGSGSSNTLAASNNPQIGAGMFGTKAIRINSGINNYSIEKLSKALHVDSNNVCFQYAFVSIFSTGHPCCDAATIQMQIRDATTNSLIPSMGFILTPTSTSGCQATACSPNYSVVGANIPYNGSNGSYIYNPWRLNQINLSAYLGQNIIIEFSVADCTAGGHYGYVYFDSECKGKEALQAQLLFNGNSILDTSSIISLTACSSFSATINASQFSTTNWNGPNGWVSNQPIVNLSLAGTYTLTAFGSCQTTSLTKIFQISLFQGIVASSSNPTICSGESVTLNATGLYNYHWSTGDTTSSIVLSPAVSTTYSVSSISTDGCYGLTYITQIVDQCTGLKSLKNIATGINIYPNPNNGEFILEIHIDLEKPVMVIENALGVTIHKQSIIKGRNMIRLKEPAEGIYYYKILENKKVISTGKIKVE